MPLNKSSEITFYIENYLLKIIINITNQTSILLKLKTNTCGITEIKDFYNKKNKH